MIPLNTTKTLLELKLDMQARFKRENWEKVKMTDYDDMRHNHCKCGNVIDWDADWQMVQCKYCGTQYKVDCDSVLVYWLEEILPKTTPWTTKPE